MLAAMESNLSGGWYNSKEESRFEVGLHSSHRFNFLTPIFVNLILFYCRSFVFSFKLLTSDVGKGSMPPKNRAAIQYSFKNNSVSGFGNTKSKPCGSCPEVTW